MKFWLKIDLLLYSLERERKKVIVIELITAINLFRKKSYCLLGYLGNYIIVSDYKVSLLTLYSQAIEIQHLIKNGWHKLVCHIIPDNKSPKPFPSFLDQDIILQAHQQQSEIDCFLAHHVIRHFFLLFHCQVYVFIWKKKKKQNFEI